VSLPRGRLPPVWRRASILARRANERPFLGGFAAGFVGGIIGLPLVRSTAKGTETKRGAAVGCALQFGLGIVPRVMGSVH
jgi:hypothetical protein